MEAFTEFLPIKPPFLDAHGRPAPLYVVTNELGSQEVSQDLRIQAAIGNTLITISGIHGLEQFANLGERVTHCLHVDANPAQKIFWAILLTSIKTYNNPRSAICSILSDFATHFGDDNNCKKLDAYFKTDHHLFSTDMGWLKVKKAVNEGRILSLSVNLGNEEEIDSFCSAFTKSGLTVDTVYVSNLRDKKWLGRKHVLDLVTKIRTLSPHRKLYVIQARKPFCICKSKLLQRIQLLSEENPTLNSVICRKEAKHKSSCILLATKQLFEQYNRSKKNEDVDIDYFETIIHEISSFDKDFVKACRNFVSLIEAGHIHKERHKQIVELEKDFFSIISEYEALDIPTIPAICFCIGRVSKAAITKTALDWNLSCPALFDF